MTTFARPTPDGTTTLRPPARDFKPELQALRALAVAAVLLYHLWPKQIRGGYIGVDVFFVLSGFLITSHIVGGVERGTFTIRGFYLRRVLRLLPAALLVLLVVGIGTILFAPPDLWPNFGGQIVASATYVENWFLAGSAVDYSAPAADTSPVQHYWSLSAEEQFYLFWPLAVVVSTVVAKRFAPRVPLRRVLLVVLGAVTLASFATSLVWTAADSASAYFSSATRAWEFGAGGVFALLRLKPIPRGWMQGLEGWGGLALIGVGIVAYSSATPFPGSAAVLPVLATLAVVHAGLPVARTGLSRIYRLRPVQLLGDVSYSLYLWHWPLIILLPLALHHALSTPLRIAIIPASILLAYLSRRFVELPFIRRAKQVRGRRVALVFVAMLAAMAVVATPGIGVQVVAHAETVTAEARLKAVLQHPGDCFGAAAIGASACLAVARSAIVPAPIIAEADDWTEGPDGVGCQIRGRASQVVACSFGVKTASYRVALIGDSHASQWQPALRAIAEERGWSLTTMVRSGCPLSATPTVATALNAQGCAAWNQNVLRLLKSQHFDLVVVSTLSSSDWVASGGLSKAASGAAGLATAWRSVLATGSKLVAIRDNPLPDHAGLPDVPTCIAEHADPSSCSTKERDSLRPDVQLAAAKAATGVHVIDLTDDFCTAGSCPAVIGGVLVYRNVQHVTQTYIRSLAPALERAMAAAGIGS